MSNRKEQLKVKNAVTLPKQEYLRLMQQAEAFRTLVAKMFELPLKDSINEVVADFRAIDLYSEEFLTDLEDGLRKSSYAKKVCKSSN